MSFELWLVILLGRVPSRWLPHLGWCGNVLRMSWWQNWRHALAHPADNVVAAMVVLAGVAITAVVTLFVSAANRRHERYRDDRGRVFESRAETYLDAISYVFAMEKEDPERPVEDEEAEEVQQLFSRLSLYGTRRSADLFWDAVTTVLETRQLELDKNSDPASLAKAKEKSDDLHADFNHAARAEIQGLRGRPRWLRQVRRRVRRSFERFGKWFKVKVLKKTPTEEV